MGIGYEVLEWDVLGAWIGMGDGLGIGRQPVATVDRVAGGDLLVKITRCWIIGDPLVNVRGFAVQADNEEVIERYGRSDGTAGGRG